MYRSTSLKYDKHFVLGSCHKHRKSQPVHDLVLCVNTTGVLDHIYPELSVARATLVLFLNSSLKKGVCVYFETGAGKSGNIVN